MGNVTDRIKNSWNAFLGREPTPSGYSYYGGSRPYGSGIRLVSTKNIISSVYNQIAIDVSSININHVRLKDNRFDSVIPSGLNYALSSSANIDQTGRSLIRDIVVSMLDEGCVAVVPVVTSTNPNITGSYDIYELRTGRILQWKPNDILVEVYNGLIGQKEQIWISKSVAAIIENPFYEIMNEPNSTAQRLGRILAQVDRMNDQNTSGRLDLIVQFPYPLKSSAQREAAKERHAEIERQLTGAHGIAFIDSAEKIVQLNRPVENQLWGQAKDLTTQLYNQLGFAESVFDGTADEKTMLNYFNRTIEPILSAITEEMERKWISKTAITQGQGIRFYRDPFKLVPVSQIAEIADKFTRNEIMTSNEIRSGIGMKPAEDPKADMLVNSNLNQPIVDSKIQNDS